jgi:hypothetical protein
MDGQRVVLLGLVEGDPPHHVVTDGGELALIENPVALAAVDLHGRSLALGAPTKVVITSRSQPSVVIAAPPMHVDYAPPVGDNTPAQVLNVSAIPGGFYSQYQTDESNTKQSSSQNTTSWSFGAQETLETSVTIGLVDIDDVKVEEKFSAQQQWKGSVETVHGTTNTTRFDLSVQTKFDHLWYNESRLNLYIYPVIGKTVCPATKPNCSDDNKVPLTVQFSGIGVIKPGSFRDPPSYAYGVTSYIFGQQQPGGVVNDLPLSGDVTTFGILQMAFVVDPLRENTGGWWKQTYGQVPDVALNHPVRWHVALSQTGSNDGPACPSTQGPRTSTALCFPPPSPTTPG